MNLVLQNSTSLNIIKPNRAIYNENKIFACLLKNEEYVNLPIVLPIFEEDDDSYPKY